MNRYVLLLVACILIGQMATGETITLKNGTVLKGSLTSMNENEVVLQTADMGTLTIKRHTIRSINDDVEQLAQPLVPQPLSPPAAIPAPANGLTITNVNNNNNNNNAAATASEEDAVAASPTPREVQPSPALAAQVAEEPSEFRVLGSLGVGYGLLHLENQNNNKSKAHGTALRWELVGLRIHDSFQADLFVDAMELKQLRKGRYLAGGLGLSVPFGHKNYASGSWSSFHVGTQLVSSMVDYEGYEAPRYSLTPYRGRDHIQARGYGVGTDLGFQYVGSAGLGFDVGLSGQLSWMDRHTGNTCDYDRYSVPVFCSSGGNIKKTRALNLTTGMSYQF
jgi:sRNA-binding regulator protein Hfq